MWREGLVLRTEEDVIETIEEVGFLPFFADVIPGFSIEEHAAPSAWFSDEPGAWEWKGPIIRKARCAYGKFFHSKAAFISAAWYPDFANYRRDGYDFDARFEDEKASWKDKRLYDLLDANAPVLSQTLKRAGDYRKGGITGFDTSIIRLQAQGYVLISDIVYRKDRYGQEYGWGVSEYSTPERFFGESFTDTVYRCPPEESYQRLLEHFRALFPDVPEAFLRKYL